MGNKNTHFVFSSSYSAVGSLGLWQEAVGSSGQVEQRLRIVRPVILGREGEGTLASLGLASIAPAGLVLLP